MTLLSSLKQRVREWFLVLIHPIDHRLEKHTVLQALLLAKENRSKTQIDNFQDVEFSGFSQWGEDGIIDWLVERLPGIPKTFIEFGVGDYKESNTRLLLYLRNWHGLIMDGSSEHISSIKQQEIYWRYDFLAKQAFIDKDNINALIEESGISGDIGLLSIDIDGNDYWVWEAIDIISPFIVVCEYNAVFGDLHSISVPYSADFQRTAAHHSNLYFGASLPAFIQLSDSKGYEFIGTNSNGCNAFFVRKDVSSLILDSLGEIKSFPSSTREARDESGALSFAHAEERLEIISQQEVYDLDGGVNKRLADYGQMYSDNWQRNN